MSRQLFIAGCGRSGTTALTNYLNAHPHICICTERYKFIPRQVRPELFAFKRILEYSTEETNLTRNRYDKLLARKDEASLEWVGDKVPSYFRHLNTLAKNNPDGAILFTYRPLEAVAASYVDRSRNPNDTWLGGKDGISLALRDWNAANRAFRSFISRHPEFPIAVISYDDFFARPGRAARMLEAFLEVEMGSEIVSGWREANVRFAETRVQKPLTDEERERLDDGRERNDEEWVLGYLAAQKKLLVSARSENNIVHDGRSVASRGKERMKRLLLHEKLLDSSRNLRLRLSAAKNAHELYGQLNNLQTRNDALKKRKDAPRGSTSTASTIANSNVVWVFGGGRTGSSWLAEMLSEAFDLTLWFEPRLGSLFEPQWMASKGGRGYAFSPEYEDQWIPAIRNFILDIGETRFPGTEGFIVKETAGSVAASLFLKAFPGSKPVLLVRDPRDVVASWNDAYSDGGWRDRQTRKVPDGNPLRRLGADEHTRKRAEHYVTSMLPALDAFEQYGGSKSFVTYEDLRKDGPGVMKRIATDLGLPKHKARQTAEKHAFEQIPESKRGAGKFFRKAEPGSWRKELTPEQVAIVEEIAGPLMDRLGYDRNA